MTTNTEALAAIREFFTSVGQAGLVLPDGWFGRPHDNLHQLTRIEGNDESLVVELDGQLVLTFAGEPRVTRTDKGLRLGRFTALAWDWTEYGSTISRHKNFATGEVELVAPMGSSLKHASDP